MGRQQIVIQYQFIRISARFHFSGHLLKIVETSNIYQPKLCTYMVSQAYIDEC